MREIKFRAWDDINKRIIYEHVEKNSFTYYGSAEILKRFAIVMQYTGLKDKNGKEIYEGDIVKKMREDMSEVDSWSEDDPRWKDSYNFPLIVDNIDYVTLDRFGFWLKKESFGYEGEDLQAPSDYEVIGNIYENPELLS